MNVIKIPHLRVAQLQTVGDSTLEICKPFEVLAPALENVKTPLANFKEGMMKDQASAAKKNELDIERDRLLSGFMHDVKAEQMFPYEAETERKALTGLLQLVRKYGTGISRLPYDDESARIDNLVTEVEALELEPLQPSGVMRWIPLLKEANTKAKAAAAEFITKSAEAAEISSASKQAPALISALEALYALLFAHVQISGDEALEKAQTEIEELIDSVR